MLVENPCMGSLSLLGVGCIVGEGGGLGKRRFGS